MKYIQFLFILNVERMGMIESKKWGRWGTTKGSFGPLNQVDIDQQTA